VLSKTLIFQQQTVPSKTYQTDDLILYNKTISMSVTTTKIRKNSTHSFHKFWIKIAAVVVGSFGPIFFLGTMESTIEPARLTLDIISWPLDGQTTYASPDTRFLSAIIGGFMLGWGVMIWCLSTKVYDLAPEGVRKSVLIGLLCWFVLDCSGSIASGNASNVFFNTLVLLTAVGPLWWPASAPAPQEPN
jgi:hypothetical protein